MKSEVDFDVYSFGEKDSVLPVYLDCISKLALPFEAHRFDVLC